MGSRSKMRSSTTISVRRPTPAARIPSIHCAARRSIASSGERAASSGSPSAGSPLPMTRNRVPSGVSSSSTRVRNSKDGPRMSRAAAVVSSFALLAGIIGAEARCSAMASPVAASSTDTETELVASPLFPIRFARSVERSRATVCPQIVSTTAHANTSRPWRVKTVGKHPANSLRVDLLGRRSACVRAGGNSSLGP